MPSMKRPASAPVPALEKALAQAERNKAAKAAKVKAAPKESEAAKSPAKSPAKKPEEAPIKVHLDPNVRGAIMGLRQADLPEGARLMLEAALPKCQATGPELHECQTMILNWVEEAMEGVRKKLQEALDKANNLEASATETRTKLQQEVDQAQADVQKKVEAVAAAETANTSAQSAVDDALKVAKEAEEALAAGASERAKAAKEKTHLESVLQNSLAPLVDEEKFSAQKAPAFLADIVPLAQKMNMDESLVAALPAVCDREPKLRSTFDNMVLERLDHSLKAERDRLQTVENTTDEEGRAKLDKANVVLTGAQEAATAAGAALTAAKEQEATAREVQSAAEEKVSNFEESLKNVEAEKTQKAMDLENFSSYNMACFEMVKTPPKPSS